VAQGESGEQIWRRRFDFPLHEWFYLHKSHTFTLDDVDGDGDRDTLFILRRKDMTASNVLVCYDEAGERMWDFTPGARVETAAGRAFTDVYNVAEFRRFDLPDGRRAVVVVGAHYIDEPTQVSVLDAADGSVISQYWHLGHIGTEPGLLAVADVNQDGSPELYLVGISNAHHRATLVVLDPLTMRGAAEEQNGLPQLQGFGRPNEIARILFRRSAMNVADSEWNIGERVWVTPESVTVSIGETFRSDVEAAVIYDLSLDLSYTRLTLNSVFPMVHQQFLEEGAISISLEEQVRRLSGVDYLVAPPWRDARAHDPEPDGNGGASADGAPARGEAAR
jgi:hypothetical protein